LSPGRFRQARLWLGRLRV